MSRRSKPTPERPDIESMLIEAQRRFDAMTPEQQRQMRADQRKSWTVGEMLLEHPEMTRDHAEEIYQKVVQGVGL